MKEGKSKTFSIVVIVLTVLVLVSFIGVSSLNKEDSNIFIETTVAISNNTENVEDNQVIEVEESNSVDEELFEFVAVSDYREDVDKLMSIVNCQYNGDYEMNDILAGMQDEYIMVELQKRFPNKDLVVDITPYMKDIYSKVKETVFNESLVLFSSKLSDEDICEEEEFVSSATDVDDIALTYPEEFYDSMRDTDGSLLYSLDEDILISRILDEYPRLDYLSDTDTWLLSKVDDSEDSYEILGNIIELKNPLEQMRGVSYYRFSIDSLRKYEDYFILSVYRGDCHLSLVAKKENNLYDILNVDDLIDALSS